MCAAIYRVSLSVFCHSHESTLSNVSSQSTLAHTIKILKDTSEIQPPPLTGHHCSAPFYIPHIDMCTFKPSEIDTSINRTAYCGPSGVLIIKVSLYRAAYCGPNGVLTIEGLLLCQYRVVYVYMCLYIHIYTAVSTLSL